MTSFCESITPSSSTESITSLNQNKYKIISIEGNIGSGKSTLLTYLAQDLTNNPNIVFLKEPVDEWAEIKDADGKTMLEKFYGDQEKYGFPFQMMAYISRLSSFKDALTINPDATVFITERSLNTDKCVFAKMLFNQGKIEDVNYQIYTKWFNTFSKEFEIDAYIYVKATPEICHERIIKRSRTGEDIIPIKYLSECHDYHENMMKEVNSECKQIHLNGNVDIFDNPEELNLWISNIKKMIDC